MVIQGDVVEKLKGLPDVSVDCCITSPPYFGLRDYGVEGQIGLEPTPDEYVAKLVEVFREVRRVLKKDGTCWLNLGDSYTSCGRSDRKESPGVGAKQEMKAPGRKLKWQAGGGHNFSWFIPSFGISLKPKDLIGIPWRVAFALQADGWWLRQDIIWAKPNPMPESVKDRCTKAHEYIFLLTKSARYYFDAEAIKEPIQDVSALRMLQGVSDHHKNINGAPGQTPHSMNKPRKNIRKEFDASMAGGGTSYVGHSGYTKADGTSLLKPTRNKRSVWTITPKPYKGAHFATFPETLVEPMVLAGCPKGGTVLDPFAGSGTTLAVAKRLGRKYIGIELNPKYISLIEDRLSRVQPPLI